MLVWPDENYPPFIIPQALQNPISHYRRHCNPYHFLESLDGSGGSRATKHECIVGSSSHALLDVCRRFVNHPRGPAPYEAVIRVGVPYNN